MLHKRKVFRELIGNARRQIRILLRLKPRARPPMLEQVPEETVERYRRICQFYRDWLPTDADLRGARVCEVGPGDGLASASLLLGRGASHVDLVESFPLALREQHLQVLQRLGKEGLPLDLGAVNVRDGAVQLNPQKITWHTCFMENFTEQAQFDWIISVSVLEHVEDLEGFFKSCWRTLRSGGQMLHIVDLSGHGELETPVPDLDFQTYPDWLFGCMSPRYHRATRRFIADYKHALAEGGFSRYELLPTRRAETTYLQEVRPKLRRVARRVPFEELAVLEFVLRARKEPA